MLPGSTYRSGTDASANWFGWNGSYLTEGSAVGLERH